MSGTVRSAELGAEDELNCTINAVPLVDIMLVMVIMFLITVPVIITTVPVELPVATNIVTETKPENVVIAVDREGRLFWNDIPLANQNELFARLAEVAVLVPQPEGHIRADTHARFEHVGRVIVTLQRASILKVGFITCPIVVEDGTC